MDHPFFTDQLSEIHQADTLYDSRFSATRENQQENWFQQQRTYAKSILSSWGINVGELHYSRENQITLRCLVDLIGYRQKQLQFRSKSKDELNVLQFERDKYRSFMQQGQRTIEQHMKRIGSLQNQLLFLKNKLKKNQITIKKEKEEDRKMILMLKNKNEQILHQIKKKQQESNRIKQQMKKNVGQKTPSKNSFDVFMNLNRSTSKQKQLNQQKYAFLMERNERDLSIAMKENSILREKIFQMRESLLQFNIWIDKEIFGEQIEQSTRNYHHKFYINHNLLFKKESLTEEFQQLLEVTKDGLIQLREIFRRNITPPKKEAEIKQIEEQTQLNFKKKAPQRKELKTDRTNNQPKQRENKNRTSINKNIQNTISQNQTPRISKQVPYQSQTQVNIKHLPNNNNKTKNLVQNKKIGLVVTKPISSNQLNTKSAKDITKLNKDQYPTQQQLLSQFSDSNDQSIISHISIQKMGKSRFDKWDILYSDEKQ